MKILLNLKCTLLLFTSILEDKLLCTSTVTVAVLEEFFSYSSITEPVLGIKESTQVVQDSLSSRRLLWEMFWARSSGRRPQGDPGHA